MLQITRKANQALVIGNARVVVIAITGKQVRLGISAPRNVPIYREEIATTFNGTHVPVTDESPHETDETDQPKE